MNHYAKEGASIATIYKALKLSKSTIYQWRKDYKQLCHNKQYSRKIFNFVRNQLPFTIRSMQVDGGSEFEGEFEQACQNYHIPLCVIPPRSPEVNGCVERANGSTKFEF